MIQTMNLNTYDTSTIVFERKKKLQISLRYYLYFLLYLMLVPEIPAKQTDRYRNPNEYNCYS